MAYPQDRNYVAIKNDIYTRFSIILENSQEIVLNEMSGSKNPRRKYNRMAMVKGTMCDSRTHHFYDKI